MELDGTPKIEGSNGIIIANQKKFKLKNATFQLIASFVVNGLSIHAGINMAFPTIVLPEILNTNETCSQCQKLLYSESEPLKMNIDEASWFASLIAIFTPVGSMLSILIMDPCGRKFPCFLSALFLVAAWGCTIAADTHIAILFVARALAGVGAGICTVSLVYVSEIAHSSFRSMLLSLNSVFFSFGILLTSVAAQIFTWREVAVINAVLAIVTFFLIFLLPESPVWLSRLKTKENLRNRRILKSLRWLYREKEFYEIEYNNLKLSHCNPGKGDENISLILNNTFATPNEDVPKKPKVLKPISILCGLFFFQQFSGSYVVIVYAIQIFKAAGSVSINEWTSLVGLGFLRFIMAIVTTFLSRSYGRRPLLLFSGIGMTLSMFTAFTLLLFLPPTIYPVICILAFVSFSSLGYMVIPWTLIGELLPNHVRGKGAGFMISYAYLVMFITIWLFMKVLSVIGIAFTLLILSTFSFFSVVYIYLTLPETFGKTFEEIAESL